MTKLTPEPQEWREELLYVLAAIGKNKMDGNGDSAIERLEKFITKLLEAKDAEKADAVEKERERVIERCVDNFVYYRVTDQPIGQRRAIVSPYFLKQILKSKLSQNDQQ